MISGDIIRGVWDDLASILVPLTLSASKNEPSGLCRLVFKADAAVTVVRGNEAALVTEFSEHAFATICDEVP